jgi:hypothetical protein
MSEPKDPLYPMHGRITWSPDFRSHADDPQDRATFAAHVAALKADMPPSLPKWKCGECKAEFPPHPEGGLFEHMRIHLAAVVTEHCTACDGDGRLLVNDSVCACPAGCANGRRTRPFSSRESAVGFDEERPVPLQHAELFEECETLRGQYASLQSMKRSLAEEFRREREEHKGTWHSYERQVAEQAAHSALDQHLFIESPFHPGQCHHAAGDARCGGHKQDHPGNAALEALATEKAAHLETQARESEHARCLAINWEAALDAEKAAHLATQAQLAPLREALERAQRFLLDDIQGMDVDCGYCGAKEEDGPHEDGCDLVDRLACVEAIHAALSTDAGKALLERLDIAEKGKPFFDTVRALLRQRRPDEASDLICVGRLLDVEERLATAESRALAETLTKERDKALAAAVELARDNAGIPTRELRDRLSQAEGLLRNLVCAVGGRTDEFDKETLQARAFLASKPGGASHG